MRCGSTTFASFEIECRLAKESTKTIAFPFGINVALCKEGTQKEVKIKITLLNVLNVLINLQSSQKVHVTWDTASLYTNIIMHRV